MRIAGRDVDVDRSGLVAVAAVVVGLVARAALAARFSPWGFLVSDPGGYADRAARLARGTPLVRLDAFYPPGTHMLLALPLLAPAHGHALAVLLTVVTSAAAPLFAWLWLKDLVPRPAAAAVAAVVALDPIFVTWTGFFLSETPALTLLLASLWASSRLASLSGRRLHAAALGAGVAAGLALAVRPQLALNLALALVPLLWRNRDALPALALGAAMPLSCAAGLELAASGHPALSENAAFNFFQGHCDVRRVRAGPTWWASPVRLQRGRGVDVDDDRPPWDQQHWLARAEDCLARDGFSHVARVGENLLDLFATSRPWPQSQRPAVDAVTAPANALLSALWPLAAAAAVWLRRDRAARLLAAHAFAIVAIAAIFYGTPRFRAPYDVFVVALCALAFVRVAPRTKVAGLSRIGRHAVASEDQ